VNLHLFNSHPCATNPTPSNCTPSFIAHSFIAPFLISFIYNIHFFAPSLFCYALYLSTLSFFLHLLPFHTSFFSTTPSQHQVALFVDSLLLLLLLLMNNPLLFLRLSSYPLYRKCHLCLFITLRSLTPLLINLSSFLLMSNPAPNGHGTQPRAIVLLLSFYMFILILSYSVVVVVVV